MGQASRRKRERAAEKTTVGTPRKRFRWLTSPLFAFAFGAILTAGGFLLFSRTGDFTRHASLELGHRTAAQLMALPDAELEKVDIVEMNIAVAREIPGLEHLDYAKYCQTVDGWTAQFRAWLPSVEHVFHQEPAKFHNDINFFRLGMLAQFLDQTCWRPLR